MGLLLLLILMIGASSIPMSDSADVGEWSVGGCILVRFSMRFSFDLMNKTDLTKPFYIEVPRNAVVDKEGSHCRENLQTIALSWKDSSDNGTDLDRNVLLDFTRSYKSEKESYYYGVHRIYGKFFVASSQTRNETFNASSYLTIENTVTNPDRMMFQVPVNNSFFCHDLKEGVRLKTHLYYNISNQPTEYLLPKSTLEAMYVGLNAFRPSKTPNNTFQAPKDCDYKPNYAVPIVVGVALASMIVLVLISYLFGRRKYKF